MSWGNVELEPEIRKWLEKLDDNAFGQAQFYVDLLEREGVGLSEPYTRHLRGKLRELRFYLGRERYRITYYIAKRAADHPADDIQEVLSKGTRGDRAC